MTTNETTAALSIARTKLGATIDNIPTGRRAWYFGQVAKDAHQAGDYITARHLLRDAKQSFKEI